VVKKYKKNEKVVERKIEEHRKAKVLSQTIDT